jgi:hypothetical protein
MGRQQHRRDALAQSAVKRITERAGRRVRGLIVSYCDGRMTVRGSADSYHVWQLAIAACRESLIEAPNVRLDCTLQIHKPLTARMNRVHQAK